MWACVCAGACACALVRVRACVFTRARVGEWARVCLRVMCLRVSSPPHASAQVIGCLCRGECASAGAAHLCTLAGRVWFELEVVEANGQALVGIAGTNFRGNVVGSDAASWSIYSRDGGMLHGWHPLTQNSSPPLFILQCMDYRFLENCNSNKCCCKPVAVTAPVHAPSMLTGLHSKVLFLQLPASLMACRERQRLPEWGSSQGLVRVGQDARGGAGPRIRHPARLRRRR